MILATRQRGKREVGFAAKVLEQLKRHHVELEAPASSDFHMHVSQMLSRMGVREKIKLAFFFFFLFIFLFIFIFIFLFPLRGRVVACAGVCSSCVAGALVLFFLCAFAPAVLTRCCGHQCRPLEQLVFGIELLAYATLRC